jgi:hypothetical protein
VALLVLLGCLGVVMLGLAGGLGWYFWQQSGGTLPIALGSGPSPGEDPGAGPDVPSLDEGASATSGLEALAGVWTLRPGDPGHDPEDPEANRVEFVPEDGILVARPPGSSDEALHLIERRGDVLRGEYLEDGMATMFTGRISSGEMVLEADGQTVRLVREN